jgi:hypothetical protein
LRQRAPIVEAWLDVEADTVRCEWVGKRSGRALVPLALWDEVQGQLPIEVVAKTLHYMVVQLTQEALS